MGGEPDWLVQPFAHRGLHDSEKGIVENTASAFQAAIDAGYGIELDVRTCGDGTVVVFHDDTLQRLTTGAGPVSDHTASQLKRVSFRASKDRIQTLPEMLEEICGRVPLLIELKTDWKTYGPLEKGVGSSLEHYQGPAAVMSFDPHSMGAMARIAPGIVRGLVAEHFADPHTPEGLSPRQRFMMRHLLSAFIAKPQFVNYDVRALPAMAPWIWRHVLQRPLLTWTVRSPEQAREARRWADAIVFEGFRP